MSGKTELCLFDGAPAQTVIDSATFTDVFPSTSITGKHEDIEFVINSNDTEYLDLNDTSLYLQLKIVRHDGTNIEESLQVLPTNFIMNALFADVQLSLNDTIVEGGDRMYAYKSTIESLFNFNEDAKRFQLMPMGFSDAIDQRKAWCADSKTFELIGALRLDFLNQPKYLLPGIDVRIRLIRNKDEFVIQTQNANARPRLQISKAVMYVRRVKINPAVAMGHQMGLIKQNVLYPYTKSQTISYSIARGSLSYHKDNIFSALRLPKFVIVGFVKSAAYNGSYQKNPYKFEHFGVNHVALLCNGQPIPFCEAYHPNFQDGLFLRDYFISIIQNPEMLNSNRNNGISAEAFKENRCFFTFNLTPDFDMASCQPPRDGNLRLDVSFQDELAEAVNVIVYGIFDSEVQVGKNKQILRGI